MATTLDRRGIWHYGGGEDKKSRLWSLPPLLRVHRQLMVAEENMFSSVAATDKLRTLIKLTGSLPFPTLQPPIHGRSQGWFYMLRNMCYKLRPTISASFFNGVTLNKLHILPKPYFPHSQNKVINRTFSTVSEGL